MHNSVIIREIESKGSKRIRVEYFFENHQGRITETRTDFYIPSIDPRAEMRPAGLTSFPLPIMKERSEGSERRSPEICENLYVPLMYFAMRKQACLEEAHIAGAYAQAIGYAQRISAALKNKPINDRTNHSDRLQQIVSDRETRLTRTRPIRAR